MPSARHLAPRGGSSSSSSSRALAEDELDLDLDLQSPSSSLRQHLDAEALPQPDYLENLDELHLWYQMRHPEVLHDHLEPCRNHVRPPTHPTSTATDRLKPKPKPKLVVCHDFQGGYNEDPHQQGYSLEHLHLVDTFIYFSHKRVSIPPVGWLHACRRTGTKVLGTLIFEWAESAPDLARLLRGPERKAMPLRGPPSFSQQYAVELIELALERGFSGYLVNIEVALDLGFSCSGEPWPAWVGQQARVGEMHKNSERLRAWVHFLREEGTRRFTQAGKRADEWEVMWYDSVVYPHGQLAWQDALNEYNIDFFQSAHTFFTNYTWARPPQPLPPGQLVDPNDESPQALQLRGFTLTGPEDGGYHPQLLLSAAMADSVERARTDVYVGIDVFGRNCWGGTKAWRSLDMIGPHRSEESALQLSVALFAPGWTWEDQDSGQTLPPAQQSMKRKWSDWWHIDLAFWIGIPRPLTPTAHRITLAEHEVKPVQLYFGGTNLESARLERRASAHGFYTDFGFGSGTRWFDRGEVVHEWPAGFTDMGVCMPKPDLLFATWHQHKQEATGLGLRDLTWTFDQERAWTGTTSLVVAMTPAYDTVRTTTEVPLCSAVVECSANQWTEWRCTIVVDGQSSAADQVSPVVSTLGSGSAEVVQRNVERTKLEHGWHAVSVPVRIRADDAAPVALSLGLSLQAGTSTVRVGAVQLTRDVPKQPIGELQIHPAMRDFESTGDQTARLQPATLVWATSRANESQLCNVWIQAVGQPDTRCWLGTSTREATASEFCLAQPLALPLHLTNTPLEFIVTTPGLDYTVIARGPARVSP